MKFGKSKVKQALRREKKARKALINNMVKDGVDYKDAVYLVEKMNKGEL